MQLSVLIPLFLVARAGAHLAPFDKGMYCLDGTTPGVINYNAQEIVRPLFMLPKSEWWFHHFDKCDEFPPKEGDFLELPAGGSFTVEIAMNRAQTTLSYNGAYASAWPDGKTYPDDYNVPTCITSPNMHTQNESMAAGSAFSISYQSDITKVTAENLAVFTVKYHTPWKRVTTYSVPAALPACPPGGCICAWGWVPNGCGEPNMYMVPYRCTVTGATSTAPVAPPVPPVWCEGNPGACVKGSKQMIYWHQQDGNNIQVDGYDLSGAPKSPAYNSKCGFADGAQNDIFAQDGGSTTAVPSSTATPTNTTSAIAAPTANTSNVPITTTATIPANSTSIPAPTTHTSVTSAPTNTTEVAFVVKPTITTTPPHTTVVNTYFSFATTTPGSSCHGTTCYSAPSWPYYLRFFRGVGQ